MKTITKKQLELAFQMHDSGISWDIISTLLKIDPLTLRKWRKHYQPN